MILGEKRNRSEDLFLEVTMIFWEEKAKDEIKAFFSFLENINFWKFLPRAPEFEHPPLAMLF